MHTTSEQLRRLLTEADQLNLSVGARERLRWFLHYIEQSQSISDTCTHFGISRSTFHRWANRFDPDDIDSIEENSRRPHHVRGTSAPIEVVERIRDYRMRWPLLGKEAIAQLLRDEWGMNVSSSMVGRIIEQFGLYFADTPLHRKKRTLHDSSRSAELPAYQSESVRDNAPWTDLRITPKPQRLSIGKTLIIASVLTNIAFIAFLLGMAGWESRRIAHEQTLSANLVQHANTPESATGRLVANNSGHLLHLEVTRINEDGTRSEASNSDIDSITRCVTNHE